MRQLLFSILLFASVISNAEQKVLDNRRYYEFGTEKEKVGQASKIIFFGYDVSRYMTTVTEKQLSDFPLCGKLGRDYKPG